ncbi:helicase-related protein [Tautonia sociabilis]|uniref:helicase-related protein n=1 Tax=Tautonia sociabilis TaxID=2080755 RepID=UPI0013158822|nr:helicase-related protein [Tautonia sociabilis]
MTYLVNDLERKLAGRHEPRFLRIVPSDHCHLGVLGPRDPNVVQPDALDPADEDEAANEVPQAGTRPAASGPADPQALVAEDDEETAETGVGEAEQIAAEQRSSNRDSTRRPPSSLGFELVATPDPEGRDIELTVDVSFCVYTQHFPTFEEQREEIGRSANAQAAAPQAGSQAATQRAMVSLIEAFIRRNVPVPPITIRIDPSRGHQRFNDGGLVQQALDSVLSDATSDPSIWREIHGNATIPVQALQTDETYQRHLQAIATGPVLRPPLRARLDVRVHPHRDGSVRIQCYLCNDTPRDPIQRFRDQHNILGDCHVTGTLVRGELAPIELLPVPRDYQFDLNVWAVGHGTSVVVSDDHHSIRTEALARFEQQRRTTSQQPTARFDDLIRDPLGSLETIRIAMERYGDDWQARIIDQNALGLRPDALEQCKNDLQAFRDEEARFASGIAAIAQDERLHRAFVGMNRVFQRTTAGRYESWHLFQIVFIVTQLPSLAIREGITAGEWPQRTPRDWSDALDWADVLWFPTGGGKTEAYLGLISCASLYDRLRGKRFGVTAWLRFPLRMLSVQQLQRAAKVVWETEQERRQLLGEAAESSDQISLGYFVGKTSTPNQLRGPDVGEWTFERLESEAPLRDKLLLVSDCPACRGQGSVRIQPDRAKQRIRHVCGACRTELPIYVSDEEVYRFLPTVIIGTIDKMATIAYQPKLSMLWGGAAWRCQQDPEHGYGLGDWCVDNCQLNPRSGSPPRRRTAIQHHDPTPSFHIQDELHLLQQELGAFAGHYETLVRSCERAVGGLPPKTVAATATVEGFEHQIRQIYGVPHARRFPTRGYDLFETFYTTADRDQDETTQPVKTARLYVAFRPPHLHAADAAALCVRLLHEELIRLYDRPYEAAAWLPTARTEEEVRHLLHFYTTTLTYVGTKARGIRIRQTLDRESSRLRPGNARDLSTEFLSGDSSLATIADAVRRIEAPPLDWAEDGHLDATVATNVISHGVDIERFNLMVMDSIPEETADYIQASSRSGRRHVGLVLAVLASYSLRASSIYHRFTEYHRHLERLVSPVSVNRFAKFAANRTIPGVFIGILLGRYGAREHTPQFTKRSIAAELLNPNAPSRLRTRIDQATLNQDVREAYALGEGIYPDGLELAMSQVLAEHVDRFLYWIRGSQRDRVVDVIQPKAMTSLRDVDVGVKFRPEEEANWYELQWFNSQS